MPDDIARYWSAVAALDARIDPLGPADHRLSAIWERARRKRERARAFLDYLGNPHLAYPVVHVTGTSGKGSTSAMIAATMTAAGYRTGLATSPYLQVATEKLQIDGRLIGPGDFADLIFETLVAGDAWREKTGGDLSYGELWLAIQSTWLAREQVDLAVIEVGAGGRFDVTNVVASCLAVITSVGLDHTQTLGPTVADIAWHKAGIIKPGVPVVSAATDPVAARIIHDEAMAQAAPLTTLDPSAATEIVAVGPDVIRWRLRHESAPVVYASRPPVPFQARNGAIALAAVAQLAQIGFTISGDALTLGLNQARLPGRAELMPGAGQPPVLLDAAHNPDKVRALVESLPALLPESASRPILVTGMLDGKDAAAMLEELLPLVGGVIATAAGVRGKDPRLPDQLAATIQRSGFRGLVTVEHDPLLAVSTAVSRAAAAHAAVLVTGSMYLVGRVREQWFPADAMLRQRTPWPEPASLSIDGDIGLVEPVIEEQTDDADHESADHQVERPLK